MNALQIAQCPHKSTGSCSPDGVKARCGGPAICPECAREQQRQEPGALKDFCSKRLTAEEWSVIREAYVETYPVRPLLNHVDELAQALRNTLDAWDWMHPHGTPYDWDDKIRDARAALASLEPSQPSQGEKP